jgi:hypothetical protein
MPSPARDFGNLRAVGGDQVFCGCLITRRNVRVMHSLPDILASVPLHWWIALIVSALGIAAICLRVLESDGVRAKRVERKSRKELRLLADRISKYGRSTHQRYPSGDVVVNVRDLSEQLRKRPDTPRYSRRRARPIVARTESPKGFVERILEIERVKSPTHRNGRTHDLIVGARTTRDASLR